MQITKHLIFSIFIFCINLQYIYTQTAANCIQGENCPYMQGICIRDRCMCLRGYQTLIPEGSTEIIYCNYPQKSRWIAFILEMFLPCLGLLYLGRYVHCFIKFSLLLTYLCQRKQASCLAILAGLAFVIMYLVDMIKILLASYYDGNGVPIL